MISGILGTKVGMTHLFTEEGKMVPVTVIQAGPVYVTQVKTEETDGYNAVQVGFGDAKDKHLTFPKFGHLKKAGLSKNLRHLREFRVEETAGIELGQEFKADLFEEGEKITVTGKSKGRGFAGGVKRYHFKGQHMRQVRRPKAPKHLKLKRRIANRGSENSSRRPTSRRYPWLR